MDSGLGDPLKGSLGRVPRSSDRVQAEASAQQEAVDAEAAAQQEAADAEAENEKDASSVRSGIQELLDLVNETRRILPPE